MKKILGFALLGAVGYYLWKNHFARLFQPKDQVKEVLEEVRLKNEIGNDKRAVFLANQVPTSTIGDTPYAGVPLTAMCSPQLMEAKGLTLLPKGGTSTPNPFDRVLSWLNVILLLLTVQVAGAAVPLFPPQKTIWVSGGGSNILTKAKSQSRAGMTIVVGPGTYMDHNLWKPGVNWFFYPGATVVWTNQTDAVGIFDDRTTGAGTNWILGGSFIYESDAGADIQFNGPFVIANPDTIADIDVERAEFQCYDVRTYGAGVFTVVDCRRTSIRCTYITDDGNGISDSYASLLYWENGDTHITFDRAEMDNGYCLWFKEPVGTPASDVYVNGQFMSTVTGAGNPIFIQFTGINPNWKAWVDVAEMNSPSGGGYGISLDGTGGKLYVRTQKIGNVNTAINIAGGTLWLDADKVSSGDGWFNATGGESYLNVRHWEDAFTNITVGWKITGGRHNIGPGYAQVLNGKGLEHFGGTNRLTGLTIDTRGTNTITSVTNNRPVTVANGASNLVLNSCVLLSPIATANGGAFSIFTTSTVSHVTFAGTTVANSNTAGVVPIVASLLTTNQPQLR